jgi:hypothetical protein
VFLLKDEIINESEMNRTCSTYENERERGGRRRNSFVSNFGTMEKSKLSLSFIKHYVMKAYRCVEDGLQHFSTQILDERGNFTPSRFTHRRKGMNRFVVSHL